MLYEVITAIQVLFEKGDPVLVLHRDDADGLKAGALVGEVDSEFAVRNNFV